MEIWNHLNLEMSIVTIGNFLDEYCYSKWINNILRKQFSVSSCNSIQFAVSPMWSIMWEDIFQLIGRGERKDSVMEIPERFYDRNSESDEDEKWRYAIHLSWQVKMDQSLYSHFRLYLLSIHQLCFISYCWYFSSDISYMQW